MEIIPLELWNTIGNKCKLNTILNIKQLSKFFHTNNIFNNSNFNNRLQRKLRKCLIKKHISYSDIIKHMVEQNGLNTIKICQSIQNKKTIITNCVHDVYPYYKLPIDHPCRDIDCGSDTCPYRYSDYVICKLCNLEYECPSCMEEYWIRENVITKKQAHLYEYKQAKCEWCSALILSYVCPFCDEPSNNCAC